MDRRILGEKIDSIIEKQIKAFEEEPIKQMFKFLVLVFILKWMWNKFKE